MPPDPLILGFDTSAAQCAAALLSGTLIRASLREEMAKGQAERLLPLLEAVLAEGSAGWADLSALAVCTGPGNFTGIRIAVAAARGLSLALGIPAFGIPAFEALAEGLPGPVLVLTEERAGRIGAQGFTPGFGPQLMTAEALRAHPWPKGLTLAGPGAAALADLPGARAAADRALPDPARIARLALPLLGSAQPRPAPLYLRDADALPPAERPPILLP